jgi:hypothetical protein
MHIIMRRETAKENKQLNEHPSSAEAATVAVWLISHSNSAHKGMQSNVKMTITV